MLLDSKVSAVRWGDRVRQPATDAPEDATEGASSDSKATQERKPVVVELANGGRHTADIVLVTVSLGVLKHSDLFDPPLPPRKMDAVKVS